MNKHYENRPDMDTPEYKAWRMHVFARDGWCCQMCYTKGKKIAAHHIKKWASYPELRYVVSNGLTLCVECHEQVTGKEEQYEAEFQKKIAAKRMEAKTKAGKKTSPSTVNHFKPKWVRRNPRNRYG